MPRAAHNPMRLAAVRPPAPLRFILGVALCALIWKYSSKGFIPALAFAAFAWALVKSPRGSPVWRSAGRGG